MKLVFTSDCHGHFSEAILPDGDILIVAGDVFANRSSNPEADAEYQIQELHALDEYCGNLSFKRVLLIAGNHDWVFERNRDAASQLQSIEYLEDSGTEIAGVKFWGSPHQP